MKRPAKNPRPLETELIREQTLDDVCLAIYNGANTPWLIATELGISLSHSVSLVNKLTGAKLARWYTPKWETSEYLALSTKFGDSLFRQVFNPDGGVRLRYAK